MDETTLAAIEERASKATQGPWRRGYPMFRCVLDHGRGPGGHGQGDCRYTFAGWMDNEHAISRDLPLTAEHTDGEAEYVCGTIGYDEGGVVRETDADFIAHARSDVPDLLAEVRRLQAELKARSEPRARIRREGTMGTFNDERWPS